MSGIELERISAVSLVELTRMSRISGVICREELFRKAVKASTPEQIADVRSALKLVPRMKWEPDQQKDLQERGFI